MLAIVLSRRDFRESDQIISLYTKERGKLEVLARGIKKIVSKQSAHVEPFSVVHVAIEAGKEIDHLTKVQPVWYAERIRGDFAASRLASYAVYVTDRLTHVHEPDPKVFDVLFGWLKYVDGNTRTLILLDAFIINVFASLGFAPILEQCVVCGKSFHDMIKEELTGAANAGFYFSGGGVICDVCRKQKSGTDEYILDCGLKEMSHLQVLLKGEWRLIEQYEISALEQKKLHRLVYEFALYHSEKKLNDWGSILG